MNDAIEAPQQLDEIFPTITPPNVASLRRHKNHKEDFEAMTRQGNNLKMKANLVRGRIEIGDVM